MLQCPSCHQELLPTARFCTRCGVPLLATATTSTAATLGSSTHLVGSRPAQTLVENDIEANETLVKKIPAGFFGQSLPTNGTLKLEESAPASSFSMPLEAQDTPTDSAGSADSYAEKKRDLVVQSSTIMASMESLLPFVYEDHRAENQALFAGALAQPRPLSDPVWGRIAFVLGAYGNYMYRYPLSAEQKRQVWNALLWAVFYERCYRRKYLAQRCQQLLHFFQGCAEDVVFRAYALKDLDNLSSYLEAAALKKLLDALQQLPYAPASLLQQIREQLAGVQEASQEKQTAQVEQQGKAFVLPRQESPVRSARRVPDKDPTQQPKSVIGPPTRSDRSQEPVSEPVPSKTSLDEIPSAAREMLGFFSDRQIQELFASLRAARLEAVNVILRSVRQPLLTSLLQELEASVPSEYQAPRRAIRLGKKHTDRFPDARRLLSSSRASDRQMALHLFEQGARETTHPNFTSLAREWVLYARAMVQGSPRVVDDWESDFQHDEASWEEIWNLALFYQQTGYPAESLRVLASGLEELQAPVVHLRLALTCALKLLLEPGNAGPTAQRGAHTFLLNHLEQWPHPLNFLAWLLLAYETHGRSIHPLQQSQRLSTFQELIEHPLTIPEPQKELSEPRITALEKALVEKARCDEAWFLWLNDYAEHHPRKYQAWARLAETSERVGRLKAAELALQHLIEIQYQHDYARYQEGAPPPQAGYLRRNLERLFEFYQHHNLAEESKEAFNSCYPSLSHLWDAQEPANRKLIALTRQHQEARQQREVPTVNTRRQGSTRELGRTITVALEQIKPGQRVGIFVDYENIAPFIPRGIDAEKAGRQLLDYAAHFGEVVCQWASASPHNLVNLADVRAGLEASGFKVRFPRRELQFSASKKNLADFALLECLSDAQANAKPDIYLIVSGDRDYYERVWSLLDTGHTVRVVAAADSQHLSLKYRELEQQRVRDRQSTGHAESDFFIDNLEDIL